MRLFIAINFSDVCLAALDSLEGIVRKCSRHSSLTPRENLHLTLEFLGECNECEMENIKKAMDDVSFSPFYISFSSLAFFRRPEGDLWYAKCDISEELEELSKELRKNLRKRGIGVENRKFKAHVTLSRRTDLEKMPVMDFDRIIEKVEHFDLMISERIDGRVRYRSLYQRHAL